MFICRGILLQKKKVNRCALLIFDHFDEGLLILLHADTPLLHKSFLCGLRGGGVAVTVTAITLLTKPMFLGRFVENDNKYDNQVRDERQLFGGL